MFFDITPDLHGMSMHQVKGPVHKFYLRHLPVDQELKLSLHQRKIPEPQLFIYGRQTIAAGKRAAPAGFIVYDPVPEIFQIFIDEGNLAKVDGRPPWILCDFSATAPKRNSLDPGKCLLKRALFFAASVPVRPDKFLKGFFPFPFHHSFYLRKAAQYVFRVIGNLGASQPDFRLRTELGKFTRQAFYQLYIPDITGKAQHIRLSPIQISQDGVLCLIDRVFGDLHTGILHIGLQAVDRQV